MGYDKNIFAEIANNINKDRLQEEIVDELNESIFVYKKDKIASLFGKENDSILKSLLNTEPKEAGGIIALNGFNFQMLVFIEYLIEMIKGKWTFLALECHDDIVAGNDDSNVVRFIQVKSSKHKAISISDSNVELYNRKKYKSQIGLSELPGNNSWLDKLFNSVSHVKHLDTSVEFEIVTDFIITNSSNISINSYSDKNRDKIISDDDYLYKSLGKECINSDGEKIDYEDKFGQSLRKLLQKFCLVHRPRIEEYTNSLGWKISETLGKGIRIEKEHIEWLIGYLISKCTLEKNREILFLTREDAEEIRLMLLQKAVDIAKPTISLSDASELLDKGIISILASIKDETLKMIISKEMEAYKVNFLKKINDKNTIQYFLKRFNDGVKPTFSDKNNNYSEDIVPFVRTSFLLYLIYDSFSFCDRFETLLIKEAVKFDQEIERIAFLNLGIQYDEEEGQDHLKKIISNASKKEQLEMLKEGKTLYTIFHGTAMDTSKTDCCIVLEIEDYYKLEVKELEQNFRANKVGTVVKILFDQHIIALYPSIKRLSNIDDIRYRISEHWETLKGKS